MTKAYFKRYAGRGPRKHVQQVTKDGNGSMDITGYCTVTGDEFTVTISEEEYERFTCGGLTAKEAFPGLTPDEREFLISGRSPAGSAKIFGDTNAHVSIKK